MTVTSEHQLSYCASVFPHCTGYYFDCSDAYRRGLTSHCLLEIKPGTLPAYKVFCRMDVNEGRGYTVIQRRMDGSVNFIQNYSAYRRGFGFLEGEYWIGLDRISQLTQSPYQRDTTLRVKMCTFDGECAEARYNYFKVLGGQFGYKVYITGYDTNSTAGDALGDEADFNRTAHLQRFSTFDFDFDRSRDNCASLSLSGWWHNRCWLANPNGQYRPSSVSDWKAIHWLPFTNRSLAFIEMMVYNDVLC